jgi:hypothetical protein
LTSTDHARQERAAPAGQVGVDWTLRSLVVGHKRLSIGALAAIVVMVAVFVATIAGPSAGAVTDSTTCSGWGAANQVRQRAYASLYVREHGSLRDGARDAAGVEAAINTGCTQAFENDVSDSINVYQAINDQY